MILSIFFSNSYSHLFILLVSGLVLPFLLMAGIYVMQKRLKLSVSYFLLVFFHFLNVVFIFKIFLFKNVKGNAELFKYLSKLQTCYSYFELLCSCLINCRNNLKKLNDLVQQKMILEYQVSSAITRLMWLRMPTSTWKSHLQGET